MLHLIFKPFEWDAVLNRVEAGDAVVFLGGSVTRLLKHGISSEILAQAAKNVYLCVLADDLVLFGIDPFDLVEGIEPIDYSGWVDLTVRHRQCLSWN